MTSRPGRLLASLSIVLVLGATACGDDDGADVRDITEDDGTGSGSHSGSGTGSGTGTGTGSHVEEETTTTTGG